MGRSPRQTDHMYRGADSQEYSAQGIVEDARAGEQCEMRQERQAEEGQER